MSLPTPVQELIDSSGNSFHARVARWFVANAWKVTVGPYYMDQSQQKARELDLVVEKFWPGTGTFRDGQGGVLTRLFVECKYVLSPAVFWFTSKNISAVEQMLCETGPFRINNTYTRKHHYLSGGDRVAKLFASTNARGQETEPFYKALNQALNGLVSLRGQVPSLFAQEQDPSQPMHVMDFPVVICSSFTEVYMADFDGVDTTEKIRDNFQLEVQYAFVDRAGQPRNELFLIDFVDFDRLPAFADALEQDASAARYMLS